MRKITGKISLKSCQLTFLWVNNQTDYKMQRDNKFWKSIKFAKRLLSFYY